MEHCSFKRKQLRTAILLMLALAVIITVTIRVGKQAEKQYVTPSALVQEDDVSSMVERYRDRTGLKMAEVCAAAAEATPQKAQLVISGMADMATMTGLLQSLDDNALSPDFFFTNYEITSKKAIMNALTAKGHTVGILGDGYSIGLSGMPGETIVSNLCRTGFTMQSSYGIQPSKMLIFDQPSDDLLYAARAAAFETVCVASDVIAVADIQTEEEAQQAIAAARYGGLLCLQLSAGSGVTLQKVNWLLNALCNTDYSATVSELISSEVEPAKQITMVYTTERAAALTFGGLGNSAELTGVLDALKSASATAIFYVAKSETDACEDDIRRILAAGHDLGIAIQDSETGDESALLKEILLVQSILQTKFGYTKELPLHPVSGSANETLLKAAAAGGFTVLSSSYSIAQNDLLRETDAQTILDAVLPASHGVLRRGEIIHFQMKRYQNSNAVTGELVKLLSTTRNIYALRSAMDILHNDEYTYVFPLPEESILPSVADKIYPGQLDNLDVFAEMKSRYLGIDWVDRSAYLPGFSREEIKQLDKKGIVVNDNNMVFFTFDDWGTDGTITKLLDVLKKHDATASFFVRTNFVLSNPNLLRAIALDGHAVGSHTDSHFPLSTVNDTGKLYTELTDHQVTELSKDLVTSYNKLQSIIGDIEVNGQPALCRIFRPPTLAVGFGGLKTVLDCGFTYSISGSSTTEDYKATSAEKLANLLKRKTKSGAVFVMHMSDNSVYTADALELYFTQMEQQKAPFRFCRITDALPTPD